MRSAKAELERARQVLEEARIVEAYATVRAPLSGRVIDKKVNAGDTVSPGQMLVTMYDPSHMQMVACVRESLALRLKVGEQVPARLDTLGYDCHSTVSEIVPEAQAESRSFHVKVTVPCPPNVYSGMFGRILIPLEDEDLLVVPAAAVRRVGQLDEVDVVADAVLSRRAVQLGRTLDEGLEVLSGLKEGEKVVLQKGAPERSAGRPVMSGQESEAGPHGVEPKRHDFLNGIVHVFLDNNFSIILIVVSVLIGLAALLVTAREEDPQIVVPLADVIVSMPGHSASEVEQLAATPLEKILYQIDGVEYVYSMSRENQAVITVRFYVGQDRERSLVKLFKKINENQDIVPPGVDRLGGQASRDRRRPDRDTDARRPGGGQLRLAAGR